MENIAKNSTLYYPPIVPENLAFGNLKNIGTGYCLKTNGMHFASKDCSDVNENWVLTWQESITHSSSKYFEPNL